MGPQKGLTGSAFSMPSNSVGGRFAQNGPQDLESPLFGVFGPFWAPDGRKISLRVAQTPRNPVNRKLPPQEAEPSKVQKVRKLRNANALPMGQKNTQKSPVAPSYSRNGALPKAYGSTRVSTRAITLPGRPPPKKKTVNRELPEKLADTTQRRQTTNVVQHERGSNKPKQTGKLPSGAELRLKRL